MRWRILGCIQRMICENGKVTRVRRLDSSKFLQENRILRHDERDQLQIHADCCSLIFSLVTSNSEYWTGYRLVAICSSINKAPAARNSRAYRPLFTCFPYRTCDVFDRKSEINSTKYSRSCRWPNKSVDLVLKCGMKTDFKCYFRAERTMFEPSQLGSGFGKFKHVPIGRQQSNSPYLR